MAAIKQWHGDVPERDDYNRPITNEFIDGKTAITRQWALMNPKSWELNGIGKLGQGYGQRYMRDADGTWVKVEG